MQFSHDPIVRFQNFMYSDDQRVMTIVMIPISIRFVNNYGFPLLERTLEFIKMQFSRDCIVEFDQNLYSDDQRVMTILMIPISMGFVHNYDFSFFDELWNS